MCRFLRESQVPLTNLWMKHIQPSPVLLVGVLRMCNWNQSFQFLYSFKIQTWLQMEEHWKFSIPYCILFRTTWGRPALEHHFPYEPISVEKPCARTAAPGLLPGRPHVVLLPWAVFQTTTGAILKQTEPNQPTNQTKNQSCCVSPLLNFLQWLPMNGQIYSRLLCMLSTSTLLPQHLLLWLQGTFHTPACLPTSPSALSPNRLSALKPFASFKRDPVSGLLPHHANMSH